MSVENNFTEFKISEVNSGYFPRSHRQETSCIISINKNIFVGTERWFSNEGRLIDDPIGPINLKSNYLGSLLNLTRQVSVIVLEDFLRRPPERQLSLLMRRGVIRRVEGTPGLIIL